jgi:acetyl-CoA C-acetyltransferase
LGRGMNNATVLDATVGLKVGDLDVIEGNEAFAAQALAVMRELELPPEKTNPNGGARHAIGPVSRFLTVRALLNSGQKELKQ